MRTMASMHTNAPDPLVLSVVSGAAGTHRLSRYYEDSGEGLGYKAGEYSLMVFNRSTLDDTEIVEITSNVRGRGYPGQPETRTYQLQWRARRRGHLWSSVL